MSEFKLGAAEFRNAVSEAGQEKEVVITADATAAAINNLAQTIGEWADRKQFREDWDDADFLRLVANHRGNVYASQEWELHGSFSDENNSRRFVSDRLNEIADRHVRLANVCKLMLMVSELAEALEGMRDGGNYGEELGDLVIRALENSQKNGIAIGDEIVKKVAKNEDRPVKHGRQF